MSKWHNQHLYVLGGMETTGGDTPPNHVTLLTEIQIKSDNTR